MCKVCTGEVHCVALWTRTLSQVWTCVRYALCTEAVHCVALWVRRWLLKPVLTNTTTRRRSSSRLSRNLSTRHADRRSLQKGGIFLLGIILFIFLLLLLLLLLFLLLLLLLVFLPLLLLLPSAFAFATFAFAFASAAFCSFTVVFSCFCVALVFFVSTSISPQLLLSCALWVFGRFRCLCCYFLSKAIVSSIKEAPVPLNTRHQKFYEGQKQINIGSK